MTDIKELSDSKLISNLANATKTYYQAGGHNKAAMNKVKCTEYKEELVRRGMPVPYDKELLEYGVFNGDGSY